MSDGVGDAAARLEQAVERLAAALAARPPHASGIPPETVAALSARLDDTLERLRGALAEIEAAGMAAPPEHGAATPDAGAAQRPALPGHDSSKES